MAKTILKVTPNKAIVKINDAGSTISLATDLLFTGQTVSGTPKVYITGVTFSNTGTAAQVDLTRNAVKVMSLAFSGQMDFPCALTENAISDIVVACPANSFVILELSKTDGYSNVIPNVGI